MSNLFKPPSPTAQPTPIAPPPMPDPRTDLRPLEAPMPADSHGIWNDSDQTAIAALDHINPFSVRDNVEYAGLIYQRGPNDFDFTWPHRGTTGESYPYTSNAPLGALSSAPTIHMAITR
jgi:hypothetical protein